MAKEPFVGDRPGKRDLILAVAAGLLFFLIYLVFSPRGIDPAIWDDLTVAAQLRPPRTIFPSLWRLLTTGIVSVFGIAGAGRALNVLGALVGGGCVFLASLLIRQTLAFLTRITRRKQWERIAPFCTAVSVFCFGASDTLARMFEPLTSDGLHLLLLLLALSGYFGWLRFGGMCRLIVVFALSGFLASESPLAFLLPLVYYILFRLVDTAARAGFYEFEGKVVDEGYGLPKWRVFFAFLFGWVFGIALNMSAYILFGGLAASGWNAFDLLFHYVLGYYFAIVSASSPVGWVLALALTVLPLVGSLALYPRLCRDNEPFSFRIGVMMFFSGLIAVLQCALFPISRFWNFSADAANINSVFLEAVFLFSAVETLALATSCFSVGCQYRFNYDIDEDQFTEPELRSPLFRNLVPIVLFLCLIPTLARMRRPYESDLRAIVDEALTETIRECGDAKFVFTDGRLDAGLELKAFEMGVTVRPLNLMSGDSAWERYLLTRHFEKDTPDYSAAETGTPVLLRIWAGERENGMDESAAQVGFDFWRRAKKPLPPRSGFVARTKGLTDEDITLGIQVSKNLAGRILAMARRRADATSSAALRRAISSVSWRISRFARLRDDDDLANQLDEWNDTVKHLMRLIEIERMRTFLQMTPYEGLRLALHRADFAEARRYGMNVLQVDSDDPEANFGVGMAYLMEEKLSDAEFYLERVLKRRPDEAAVLNNLSIIYRKTNRLDKSLEYVKRAYDILPENDEIKRTFKETERAVSNRVQVLRSAFRR